MMTEQPFTEPVEEQAETIEVLATVFLDWKQTHPDGTWQDFWTAVGQRRSADARLATIPCPV